MYRPRIDIHVPCRISGCLPEFVEEEDKTSGFLFVKIFLFILKRKDNRVHFYFPLKEEKDIQSIGHIIIFVPAAMVEYILHKYRGKSIHFITIIDILMDCSFYICLNNSLTIQIRNEINHYNSYLLFETFFKLRKSIYNKQLPIINFNGIQQEEKTLEWRNSFNHTLLIIYKPWIVIDKRHQCVVCSKFNNNVKCLMTRIGRHNLLLGFFYGDACSCRVKKNLISLSPAMQNNIFDLLIVENNLKNLL
jgi:hypothetical protein